MIANFTMAAMPHIHFGVGKRHTLSSILQSYGKKVLLITGGASFDTSPICQSLWQELSQQYDIKREKVVGEPSPAMVDAWV